VNLKAQSAAVDWRVCRRVCRVRRTQRSRLRAWNRGIRFTRRVLQGTLPGVQQKVRRRPYSAARELTQRAPGQSAAGKLEPILIRVLRQMGLIRGRRRGIRRGQSIRGRRRVTGGVRSIRGERNRRLCIPGRVNLPFMGPRSGPLIPSNRSGLAGGNLVTGSITFQYRGGGQRWGRFFGSRPIAGKFRWK